MAERRCPTCNARLADRSVAATDGGRERARTFPFCSARCRAADLGSWLDGRYALVDEDPALGAFAVPGPTPEPHEGDS